MSEKQNCFIFVFNDAKFELENHLNSKTWPLYKFTPCRNMIQPCDKILFYEAGEGAHRFIGSARVDRIQDAKNNEKLVLMNELKICQKPLDIKKIMPKLYFIRNRKKYGFYLAAGVRRIEESDFLQICHYQ